VDKKLALKELLQRKKMGSRGIINDKWSMRILWGCAIGSAIGLYMVAVERQTQNRARAMAESLRAAESQGDGDNV
jgi:hypothetical protein